MWPWQSREVSPQDPLVPLAAHRGGRPLRPGDLALLPLLGAPGCCPPSARGCALLARFPEMGIGLGALFRAPITCLVRWVACRWEPLPPARVTAQSPDLSASQGQAPPAQPDPALGFSSSYQLGTTGTGHCLGRRHCWGTAHPIRPRAPCAFFLGLYWELQASKWTVSSLGPLGRQWHPVCSCAPSRGAQRLPSPESIVLTQGGVARRLPAGLAPSAQEGFVQ